MNAVLIPRHAARRINEALADTRIVTVEGPRQAGKSTLCAGIAHARGLPGVTLDDANVLRGAIDDPTGFVAGLGDGAFIDELQRAPELVLALKAEVDRDPRAGRFLVTGSANLLLAPRIGDSLAGRVERVPLRPFTQAEIARTGVPAGWMRSGRATLRPCSRQRTSAGLLTRNASRRVAFPL